MDARVKQEVQFEIPNDRERRRRNNTVRPQPPPESVINLSSSSSSSGSDSDSYVGELDSVIANAVKSGGGSPTKKRKVKHSDVVLPVGFLSPLPPPPPPSSQQSQPLLTLPPPPAWASTSAASLNRTVTLQGCKQFWKAGDYDGSPGTAFEASTGSFFLL